MKTRRLVLPASIALVCLTTLLAFQNCSKFSSANTNLQSQTPLPLPLPILTVGYLDGNYTTTAWSCGSKSILNEMMAAKPVNANFSVSGATGTETLKYSDGCTQTQQLEISYPNATTLRVALGAITCSAACGVSECTASGAPSPAASADFSFTGSSPNFTLTRTLTSAEVSNPGLIYGPAGCSGGDTVNLQLGSLKTYNNLPFAFAASIDTIGYMSCSGISGAADANTYFTLRALASSAGSGLRMSSAFAAATQSLSANDRAVALGAADYNSRTFLSLSVRQINQYQSIFSEANPPTAAAMSAFFPALGSASVAQPLANLSASQTLNQVTVSGSTVPMSASLNFLDSETVANSLRDKLSTNTALMVAGYTSSTASGDIGLRSPVDLSAISGQTNNSSVFGTGYKIGFSLPLGYVAGNKRVISSIQEINLVDGQANSGSSWNCDTNFEFMIIRPEDIAASTVICHAIADQYSTPAQQAALSAIRHVLRAQDWYVDMDNHCIIPKAGGDVCYGPLGNKAIAYGINNCVDSATVACPHFVNVCIRQ